MNLELQPESEVTKLYVKRKGAGRGLVCRERCIKEEVKSLTWYVQGSLEESIEAVTLKSSEP